MRLPYLIYICISILFFLNLFFVTPIYAAAITWDGGGVDNNWSTANNWSGNVVPTAADDVTFNATSTKDATINSNIIVDSLTMATGYTGTITQGTGITFEADQASVAFTIQSGIFSGSNASISVSGGTFSQTGGTFTNTSDIFHARGLSITGGTFNPGTGTIDFYNGTSSSVLCNGVAFPKVTLNKSSPVYSLTFDSSCNVTITGTNPISTGSVINSGIMTIDGNWTLGGYTSNSGATLNHSGSTLTTTYNGITLNGGALDSSISTFHTPGSFSNIGNVLANGKDLYIEGTGGGVVITCGNATFNSVSIAKQSSTYTVTISSDCVIPIAGTNPTSTGDIINNGTINVTGNWDLTGGQYTQNAGGVLNQTGSTFTVIDLTLNGGTFDSGISTINLLGSYDNSGNILHTGVDFVLSDSGNVSFTCSGSEDFNSITLSRSYIYIITVSSACDLPINGTNPVSTGRITNYGTITVNGNWSISNYQGEAGSTLNISGTLLTLSYVGLTLNGGDILGGLTTIDSIGTLSLYSGSLPNTITTVSTEGSFDDSGNLLPSGVNLTLEGSGNVTFLCSQINHLNSLTIIRSYVYNLTTLGSCYIDQDFTFTTANWNNPASVYTFYVGGDVTHSTSGSTFTAANLTIEMNGTGDQIFTKNATNNFGSPLVINKTSGKVQLSANATLTSTCNLTQGTLDLNGYYLNCSSLSIGANTILQASGSELASLSPTPTFGTNSILEILGDGDSIQDYYLMDNLPTVENLTINTTDSSDTIINNSSFLGSNLLGYWKMDEGTGTTVDDSSTNNNTGTFTNNTSFNATKPTLKVSNAYSTYYDGTNDYIDLGANLNIGQNKSAVTISAWIYSTNNATQGTILTLGANTGTSAAQTRAYLATYVGAEFICGGQSTDAETWQYKITSSTDYSANTWHHVLCTIDYANDQISIYLNGVLQAVNSSPTTNFSQVTTANTTSLRNYIGVAIDQGLDFVGYIDEVQFYDTKLNTDLIRYLASGYTKDYVLTSKSIANNFTINQGTFITPTTFTVGGNWANTGGTFTHNNGSVILDGTSQLISGSTTFYNLTKDVTTADTLTFTAGTTQTIVNTLDLQGASGQRLSLRSSTPTTQWSIDPQASRTMSYLDIRDGNNTNATEIDVQGTNSINSGNNTNWDFGPIPVVSLTALTPDPTTDNTPTISGSVTDSDGTIVSVEFQMNGTGGSWSSCTADDATFDENAETFTCTTGSLSEGSNTIYVRSTDNDSGVSTNSTDTFVVDTVNPTAPGIPTAITASDDNTPTWNWSESTDATSGLSSSTAYTLQWSLDSGFSTGVYTDTLGTSACTSGTCSFSHSSTLVDGIWYFRVKTTDNVGNETSYSTSSSLTISTDSASPTGSLNISIDPDSNPLYTSNRDVTLNISGNDDSTTEENLLMKISESSSFDGITWENFATTKSFTLSEYSETKTIYILFKDEVGNQSSSYSDSIIYDVTDPTKPKLDTPTNDSISTTDKPTFRFKKALDDHSGISKYQLIINEKTAIDDINPESPGSSENNKRTTNDAYIKYVGDYIEIEIKNSLDNKSYNWAIRVIDNVGNTKSSNMRGFSVDTEKPNLTLKSIDSDNSYEIKTTSDFGKAFLTTNLNPTFNGTSESKSKVTIEIDSTNYSCDSTTNDSGNWSCKLQGNLTIGQRYKLKISSTDEAGNTSQLPDTYLMIANSTAKINVEEAMAEEVVQTETQKEEDIIEETKLEEITNQDNLITEKNEEIKTYKMVLKIIDNQNNPIANAKVTVFSNPHETYTNEKGEAIFDDMPEGTHKVFVEHDNTTGTQEIELDSLNETVEFKIMLMKSNSLPFWTWLVMIIGSLSTISLVYKFLVNKR